MIKDRNFICISTSQWEGDFAKTIVELISVVARNNKVLYVDYQFTIKDMVFSLFGKSEAPISRMLGLKNRVRKMQVEGGHFVYLLTPPPILPINFLPNGFLYRTLLKFNGWQIARAARKALKKHGLEKDLINITAFIPALGVVTAGKFNEKTILYHCYDEIEAAAWLKKHGGRHEKDFMQMADAVITTSEGLYRVKKEFAKRCFLVKNAVNFDLFKEGLTEVDTPVKKTIGYIGSIDDRVDYDLLEYLISEMKDHEFDFVGRLNYEEGKKRLSKFNNVKLSGPRPVTELPKVLKTFSVGIIPFVKNEFTKGIYPLKINEYLAAGLPVVMTHFSILDDFIHIASIAEDKYAFLQMVEAELKNDTMELKRKRQAFAAENSWEARVDEISVIIEELEKGR